MKKKKVIHLISMSYTFCQSLCCQNNIFPIEDSLDIQNDKQYYNSGTFNPKKVTCKRCLKHNKYKEAVDKVENPLFYWKDHEI